MPISTDEDEDEEDRGDDALLREALAWIATRNTSFVYALSEEWDLELHRVAERQGVEMKFAKTARDAWTLLRDAICSGRVRAVGVYGAIAEAWFRGEGQELVPDVTDDLELVSCFKQAIVKPKTGEPYPDQSC
jgi:hypothetical protein